MRIAVVLFALIAAAPILIGLESWLNLVIVTLYAALLGQAWNILGGYGGQFSFGHAAYFGTGAYTVAVLQVHLGVNPWFGLFLGGLTATAVAGPGSGDQTWPPVTMRSAITAPRSAEGRQPAPRRRRARRGR